MWSRQAVDSSLQGSKVLNFFKHHLKPRKVGATWKLFSSACLRCRGGRIWSRRMKGPEKEGVRIRGRMGGRVEGWMDGWMQEEREMPDKFEMPSCSFYNCTSEKNASFTWVCWVSANEMKLISNHHRCKLIWQHTHTHRQTESLLSLDLTSALTS